MDKNLLVEFPLLNPIIIVVVVVVVVVIIIIINRFSHDVVTSGVPFDVMPGEDPYRVVETL